MLPRTNRLRKTADFRAVFAKRSGAKEGQLLLKARASGAKVSRVGIVVSKKIAKQAVARNRMRRMIAQAIQRELGRVKTGADIVVVVLPGFELTNLEDLRQKIQKLLRKAALFKHD